MIICHENVVRNLVKHWMPGSGAGKVAQVLGGMLLKSEASEAWQRLGKGLAKWAVWLVFHGISPGSYQCSTGYQYYMQYIIQYYYIYIYMCEDDIISYPAGATVLPFRSGALGSYELSFPTIGKLGLKIFKLLGHGITMCV